MFALKAFPKGRKLRVSDKHKHFISSSKYQNLEYCSICGNELGETFYYCPSCGKYYCRSCAKPSLGGNVCPTCRDLVFLQIVKVNVS